MNIETQGAVAALFALVVETGYHTLDTDGDFDGVDPEAIREELAMAIEETAQRLGFAELTAEEHGELADMALVNFPELREYLIATTTQGESQ